MESSEVVERSVLHRSVESLIDGIRRQLPGTRRLRLAAGTLLMDGMVGLCLGVPGSPIEMLVRNPDEDSLDDLLVANGSKELLQHALEKRARPRAGSVRQVTEALRRLARRNLELMDQSAHYEAAIRACHTRMLAGDVKLRVLMQGDISTKFLLLDGADATVLSGHNPLAAHYERACASALILSEGLAAECNRWFTEQWDVAHDFAEVIVAELAASWAIASCTPYDAYVQMALHYAGADGNLESHLAWSHPVFGLLTDFQRDAVKQAARMVERHNGCFVADVVGLGKSYIGSALLKYFEQVHGLRPLIVCPATLVEMWEQHSERWELGARVVSAGALTHKSELAPAFRLETNQLRAREIVLIDESHMFRNAGTQRYDLLSHFLSSGRRVILLTATPMNRRPSDVYNQMKLFHPHERTHLPVSPAVLREFFDRVDAGRARLPDLLSHVLVRRTRREIIRVYGRDEATGQRVRPDQVDDFASGRRRVRFEVNGQTFGFPTRELQTVNYNMEASYGPGGYDRIRDLLIPKPNAPGAALTYARYRRLHYVRSEHRHLYAGIVGTANGLSALMRTLLFKRLESSTAAFSGTTSRMFSAISTLLVELEKRGSYSHPGSPDLTDSTAEQDALEEVDYVEGAIKAEHLELDKFLNDLRSDREILGRLRDIVRHIQPSENAKLIELRRLFQSRSLSQQKVLIFTEFRETAELLSSQLSVWFPLLAIESCTGSSGNRSRIPVRFSPRANPGIPRRNEESEIDVLISTDVLSEGVNLQDGNVVINFDLHWNPVRLIQRFGRVDRIGSIHEQIFAFNFLPETALDANLGLRATLANRIREIHEVIGEDSAILDPTEQINEQAMYAIYEGRPVSDEELSGASATSAVQDALGLLASLKEDSPEVVDRISKCPIGKRAARRLGGGIEFAMVMLRSGTELRFYRCVPGRAPEQVTADVGFLAVSCSPDELSMPVPPWLGELVEHARSGYWFDLQEREGDRKLRPRLREGQRGAVERLQQLASGVDDAEVRTRIEELESMIIPELPTAVVNSLRAITTRNLPDASFLDELTRLCLSHHLHRRRDLGGSSDVGPIEVITSVAFVAQPIQGSV